MSPYFPKEAAFTEGGATCCEKIVLGIGFAKRKNTTVKMYNFIFISLL